MPELPEVEAVRRRLERAMRGTTIARVLLRRSNLRRPFPEGFASRLERQAIRSLRRRGKYLLLDLSSGDVLLIHLGASSEPVMVSGTTISPLALRRRASSWTLSTPAATRSAATIARPRRSTDRSKPIRPLRTKRK
jgi:formamidopyrimidine-DNA glycosylase